MNNEHVLFAPERFHVLTLFGDGTFRIQYMRDMDVKRKEQEDARFSLQPAFGRKLIESSSCWIYTRHKNHVCQ